MLLLLTLAACTPSSDVDTSDPGRLDTGGASALEVDGERILADVEHLASDAMQGRLPATQGNEAALRHVERELAAWGLTPAGTDGWRQRVPLDQWVQHGPASLRLDEEELPGGAFRVMEMSGPAEVEAQVVFVGYGLTVPPFEASDWPACPLPESGWDDYAGVDVSGKIVAMLRHGPEDLEAVHERCPSNEAGGGETGQLWNFGYKGENAALHGAEAALLVNDFRHEAEPPQGTLGRPVAIPVLATHRDVLQARLPDLATWAREIDESFAPGSVATGLTAAVSVDAGVVERDTYNLHAVVPGSDAHLADEVIIVGAHIDHIGWDQESGTVFNGADDNASGSAVALELARLAARTEPARTLLFSWYNAEEMGLIGSCYYVREEPLYPLADTALMLSVDMVGLGSATGINLFGASEELAWIADLATAAAQEAELEGTALAFDPLLASDHACFFAADLPAVLLSSTGPHGTYHTPEDDPEDIDVDTLAISAKMTWALLGPMADGTEDAYLGGRRSREAAPVGSLHPLHRDR